MKETISLLLISLAVLVVSANTFKNVSTSAITVQDSSAGYSSKGSESKAENNKKTEDKEEKNETSEKAEEQTAEQTAEAPAETPEAPAEQATEQPAPTSTPAPAPAPAPAPTPAPAPVVDRSYANVSPYSSAADRLNSAYLNPQYTSCAELNNVISSILSQIISPNMSNYEKAKACYTYIIANCGEGYISGSYSYKTGGWNVNAQALALFTEYRGMCDCYSAGFTVLARAVGFNCSQVEGNIPYYTDHDWCEINVGGVRYIFDPDVEEDRTHSGTEYYFCKTYSELTEYQYLRTIG